MEWRHKPNRLHFLLATVLWVLIISSFSTTHFSASNTAPFLEELLRSLFPSLSFGVIHSIHVFIRKLAHFSEFGIFAVLVFGIFAVKKDYWKINWLIYSMVGVITLALLDEYHQAFVRNRNASLGDSLIDILGGMTFLLLIWFFKRNKFINTLYRK